MKKNKKASLESLLDPEKRIAAKLESALETVQESKIVLVIIESEHYSAIETGLLDFLKKHRQKGVYVSVNKPLVNLFKKPEMLLNETNTIFVDMFSQSANLEQLRGKNTRYLESPKNLLELTMLIEQELKFLPLEGRFVVLDSLSTLLLYNKPESVEKFVHNVTGKLRALKALTIFLVVRLKENLDTVRVISQFCDYTIDIAEEQDKSQ